MEVDFGAGGKVVDEFDHRTALINAIEVEVVIEDSDRGGESIGVANAGNITRASDPRVGAAGCTVIYRQQMGSGIYMVCLPDFPAYAELHAISNFTFLRGASHPEELVQRAHELAYTAIAITDECSLSGLVRAHVEAQKQAIKLIIGIGATSHTIIKCN